MTIDSPLDAVSHRQRRLALSQSATDQGLDSVEVRSEPYQPGRYRLLLHFVPAAPGVVKSAAPRELTASHLRILDGVGKPASARIVSVERPATADAPVVVEIRLPDGESQAGHDLPYSYILELIDLPRVDRFFRSATFTVAKGGAGGAPWRPAASSAAEPAETPAIDYLSRDYQGFRRLIFDHLAQLAPTWTERSPADLGNVLVELLAYAGDYLSYYQDAVATEAYLGTARQRISVRRHARLLNYPMHDGCNARCWVQVQVLADHVILPAGTPLLTGHDRTPAISPRDLIVHAESYRWAHYFETMDDIELFVAHNEIAIHDWGVRDYRLHAGATSATLVGHLDQLHAGDVLVFEELANPLGGHLDANVTHHRHSVRLIAEPALGVDRALGLPVTDVTWGAADALPFDVWVSAFKDGQLSEKLNVVRGNVVLADHGRTISEEILPPVPQTGRYRPRLLRTGVTMCQPYDAVRARAQPASAAVVQDPRLALPAVQLTELNEDDLGAVASASGGTAWRARRDLLTTGQLDRDFVVELDNAGTAVLRFGNDVYGKQPVVGAQFRATYRVGNGTRGDLGLDTLRRIVTDQTRIAAVRNLTNGAGSVDPEDIDDVRLRAAPTLYPAQSCVTEEDYAAAAQRYPEVLNARARLRWSGGWRTVFIYVQRRGGKTVDDPFKQELRDFLSPFRLAGFDLEIAAPTFVSLDIALLVEVGDGFSRLSAEHNLLVAFSDGVLPNGQPGFFHPDNFTFGQTVYLSQIVAVAEATVGISSVDWQRHGRFQRWGSLPRGELAAGQIGLGPLEIAQLRNNPNAPQLGTLSFNLRGGTW